MTRIPFVAFLTVLVLSIAACDSTTSLADLEPSTFTLRIDGGEDMLRSPAFYRSGPIQGLEAFGIALGSTPPEATLEDADLGYLGIGGLGTLSVGTYDVADMYSEEYAGDSTAIVGLYHLREEGESAAGTLYSQGGTLTITSLTPEGIAEGSFSIIVDWSDWSSNVFEPSGNPLLLEGTFSANYLDTWGLD